MNKNKIKKISSTKIEYFYHTNQILIEFKDDASVYYGIKQETFCGKGKIVRSIAQKIYEELEKNEIKTYYIKVFDDITLLCRDYQRIPLEIVVRNVSCGKMSERLGIIDGILLHHPVCELRYLNESLNNPFINDDYATSLDLVDASTLKELYRIADHCNRVLRTYFEKIEIRLVDFKLKFGYDLEDQTLFVACDITPDTSRLWDLHTSERLDKDVLKLDLGNLMECYQKILNRMEKHG